MQKGFFIFFTSALSLLTVLTATSQAKMTTAADSAKNIEGMYQTIFMDSSGKMDNTIYKNDTVFKTPYREAYKKGQGFFILKRKKLVEDVLLTDRFIRNGDTLIFICFNTFSKITKQKMVDAFFEVYPQEVKRFNKHALTTVTFNVYPNYTGVAVSYYTGMVLYNPVWMLNNPEDIDVVTHEVMHIVQSFTINNQPLWLSEGMADYVRYIYGVQNAKSGWVMYDYAPGQHYTNSYRITARFLVWIEKNVYKNIVNDMDNAMRLNTYTPALWKQLTGKTVDELWNDYAKNPKLETTYR